MIATGTLSKPGQILKWERHGQSQSQSQPILLLRIQNVGYIRNYSNKTDYKIKFKKLKINMHIPMHSKHGTHKCIVKE